ncbi:MAG: nuclear transport factor 2 family protein [Dietzia sp.]
MSDTFTAYDPSRLPDAVVAYLDAHGQYRSADAGATFAPGATVVDDGSTYRGIDEIVAWVDRSATEYEVTHTRVGQSGADTDRPVVRVRLDGTFPAVR